MTDDNGKIVPVAQAGALGAALRAARKEAGLSQAQLAELAGVSERTLRDIEKGAASSALSAVIAVASTLGLRVTVGR